MPGYILQPLLSFITPIQLDTYQNYLCGTEKAEITLPHRRISYKHCIFQVEPTGFQVLDLKSEFGTYVNGEQITPLESKIIKVNDIIGISNHQTHDIDLDKPYVYRLEKCPQSIKTEEFGAKRRNDTFSEIPNKIVKVENNNDCEIIDLTNDVDDCGFQIKHHKAENEIIATDKPDNEATATTVKTEFDTSAAEEDQETDIDEDLIDNQNELQHSKSNLDISPAVKPIENTTDSSESSTVKPYPSRKIIVYSAKNMKKIQENSKNKNTLENQDQENVPPVLSNKVQTSVIQKSTLETDDLESTKATSIKSAIVEKKSSDSMESASSINKTASKNKYYSSRDLRNYLNSKNEEKKKNHETKSDVSSDKQHNQLKSTLVVKKQFSNLPDTIVNKDERKSVQENLKQRAVEKQSKGQLKEDKSTGQSKRDNSGGYSINNRKISLSNTDNINQAVETLDEKEKGGRDIKNSDSSSTTKTNILSGHNHYQKIKVLGIETLNAKGEEIRNNHAATLDEKNSNDSLEPVPKTKDLGICSSDDVVAEASNEQVVGSTDMQSSLSKEQERFDYELLLDDSDFDDFIDIDLKSEIDTISLQDDATSIRETINDNPDTNEQTSLSHDEPNDTEGSSEPPELEKLGDYAQSFKEYKRISFSSELPIGFLLSFLKWNPTWVTADKKISITRQEFGNRKSSSYALSYADFKSYYTDMTKLILQELWAFVVNKIRNKEHEPQYVYASICQKSVNQTPRDSNNNSLTVLEIKTTKNKYLSIGDLIVLKFKFSSNSIKIFAYVSGIRKTRANHTSTYNKFQESKRFLYSIVTNSLPRNVDYDQPHELMKVYNISPFIRMAKGVECLPLSPLVDILKPLSAQKILPKLETFISSSNYKEHHFVTGDDLDNEQKETILKITNVINEGSPKICLIDGPPGSGKSTIITNTIAEIMNNFNKNNEKRQRILACASSNAAVDALTIELIKIRNKLEAEHHYTPYNVVRFGRYHSPSSTVKDVSFYKLAEGRNRDDVLLEADIIISTLSSCYSYGMELMFGKDREKIYACIIDDATLCCEPESLIPLKLNVEQFVLVGDTKELPTSFFSEIVKNNINHTSLLSRIHENLQFDNDKNSFLKLNAQYRTSEDIFSWPNSYFYKGNIQTKVSYTNMWPFYNYKVFNYHSDENNLYYNDEANFVINLMDNINLYSPLSSISIGVFTYNFEQRRKIEDLWKRRLYSSDDLRRRNGRQVTVEILSGKIHRREYDVFIMCYGREKESGSLPVEQLLYLLFTRVKYSLFICGDFDSLKPEGIWKNLVQHAQKKSFYKLVDFKNNVEQVKNVVKKH